MSLRIIICIKQSEMYKISGCDPFSRKTPKEDQNISFVKAFIRLFYRISSLSRFKAVLLMDYGLNRYTKVILFCIFY